MIVVTGATGHIGNVLVRELLTRGEAVRALKLPTENAVSLDGLSVEIVEGDVLDIDSLTRAFKGADCVFHLAGAVSILPGRHDLLHRVNVVGTRNVVKACFQSGVRRLVYTSSIHAIYAPALTSVIDETLPFDPERARGEYDKSKAQATLEVLQGVRQGLDAVVVCPTGVIGPYDFRPSEMGQLFIDFARGKLKAYVEGAYDFVDVRDAAVGHLLACEKGRSGEAYILSGERISIKQLMLILKGVTGKNPPSLRIPIWLAKVIARFTPLYYRLTDTQPRLTEYSIDTLTQKSEVSSEKAARELGYSPRAIRESVEDSIRWFRENGWFQDVGRRI